ncbi:MAG: Gfo/Idh/MocA family oxidoreductase [Pseudomonadota bacterium]
MTARGSSPAPLKVGLLGAGYFAAYHRDAWTRIEGVHLAATADTDPAKGADHDSLEAMLQAQPLDVVDIATPPPTHAAAIRKALTHKPKLIICQKPFCTSLEEAERLTAEAEAADIPLLIHENFRFQPWFRTFRQALDDRRTGRVMTLTFRLRTGDGQGEDAYLARQPYFRTMPRLLIHETGVHYLDTFRYLLGEPDGIYADLRRLNPAIRGEDAGHVILDYGPGARAVLDANRCADLDTDDARRTFGDATLEGEDATLTLTPDGTVTLRAHGTRQTDTLLSARDWPGFAGDSVHAFQAHAVAALRGEGALETQARDYLRTLNLVGQAYASAGAKARLPV